MSEGHHHQPDELYTLRTQYVLGHYNLALNEAKQMSRRPISSTQLKIEREEYIYKCYIALQQYDKCTVSTDNSTTSPGLHALVLKAQYEAAVSTNSSSKDTLDEIYNTMKSHASNHPTNSTVQLCTAQVAIMNHETQYAYQLLVSSPSGTNNNVDCIALKIQLLLKIDRIDLAQKELHTLQRIVGEDHVLVELCLIYIALSIGSSQANDAEHRLITLCEQYGPSIYLLNLLCIAYTIQGNYVMAEQKLQECLRDFNTEMTISQKVDTYLNLLCIYHQQPNTKSVDANHILNELLTMHSNSSTSSSCSALQQFHTNYERVVSAYDREAMRYMTN